MDQYREMLEKFSTLEKKVDKIFDALTGNDLNEDGIVSRLKRVEEKLAFWDKVKIGAGILITAVTIVFNIVWKILEKYSGSH